MASSSKCQDVFVGDFVSFFNGTEGLGKIKKFFVKVCYVASYVKTCLQCTVITG